MHIWKKEYVKALVFKEIKTVFYRFHTFSTKNILVSIFYFEFASVTKRGTFKIKNSRSYFFAKIRHCYLNRLLFSLFKAKHWSQFVRWVGFELWFIKVAESLANSRLSFL